MSSIEKQTPLKVGILGVASIAHKNSSAICHPASSCQLTAVASRNKDKAESFVRNWCRKQPGCGDNDEILVFGGTDAYDNLIFSEGIVDALYIPLPTSLHNKWVTKALSSGKHVLIEKPVSLHSSDFAALRDTAIRNKKFLQDGTMFVHNPRTKEFLQRVSNVECFGSVDRIHSTFTYFGDEEFFATNVRVKKDGDPLGCIGDLGWYCIRIGLLVYDSIGAGTAISAQVLHVKETAGGVPIDATCLVTFEGNRLLSFHCSFKHPLNQIVEVNGRDEIAILNDFAIPQGDSNRILVQRQHLTPHDKHTVINVESIDSYSGDPPQETLMWSHFSRMARGIDEHGSWEKSHVSGEAFGAVHMAMETQLIVDALMESIGKSGEKIIIERETV